MQGSSCRGYEGVPHLSPQRGAAISLPGYEVSPISTRGVQGSPCRGYGGVPHLSLPFLLPLSPARGEGVGGEGTSSSTSQWGAGVSLPGVAGGVRHSLLHHGVQGSPCRGYGGVPHPYYQRGAGHSLPGVWGCPPSLLPKGCRALPAGGMGVSPFYSLFLRPLSPCGRGGWGVRGLLLLLFRGMGVSPMRFSLERLPFAGACAIIQCHAAGRETPGVTFHVTPVVLPAGQRAESSPTPVLSIATTSGELDGNG